MKNNDEGEQRNRRVKRWEENLQAIHRLYKFGEKQ